MKPKSIVYKFAKGEKVCVCGKECVILDLGMNINKLPLYKIGETWFKESEIEKWYPPLPV